MFCRCEIGLWDLGWARGTPWVDLKIQISSVALLGDTGFHPRFFPLLASQIGLVGGKGKILVAAQTFAMH